VAPDEDAEEAVSSIQDAEEGKSVPWPEHTGSEYTGEVQKLIHCMCFLFGGLAS